MSFSFFIPCRVPPDFQQTVAALSFGDLECEEGDELPTMGHWPEGFVYHFYRRGVSTRSVEVAFERDEFTIRLLSGACRADFELGFAFLEAAGALAGSTTVSAEDGRTVDLDEFRDVFDDQWITRTLESWIDVIPVIIRQNESVMSFHGPTRMFHIGPEVLDELSSEAKFAEALHAKMRSVFYPRDELVEPDVMSAQTPEERFATICVWAGEAAILPRTDYISLGDDESPLVVNYEVVVDAVLGATRVDELQYRVPAHDAGAWLDLCEALVEHAVDPARLRARPPRWWQFWK